MKLYELIFKNNRDAILVTNSDGTILRTNPSFKELLEYNNNENITDLGITPSQLEELRSSPVQEWELRSKTGTMIPCEVSLSDFSTDGDDLSIIFINDLTDLKKTQNDLGISEKRFQSLANNAADALFVHDFQGNFVDVNKQASESLGYSREELLQMTVMDVDEDFDLESAQKEWSKIKIGESFTLYGHHKRKNGSIFPVEVRLAAMDVEGERMFMGAARNITERHKIEEDLQKSHEWLGFAQKAAKSGFWDWDMATEKLTWTPELFDLFGITPDKEPTFDIWLERIHPDDRESAMNNINRSIEDHTFLENEYRMILPEGKEIWIKALGTTAYDEKDQPQRMSGICMDITSAKEAEIMHAKSEERYHSLFENMLNGLAYCKMIFNDGKPVDFIYLNVNHAFESLTGLKDVTGKKVSEIIPDIQESDPELFEIYGRVASTGQPEVFETFLESLKMWFSVSVYSPKKEYFVAVFDVITERKKAEKAMQELLENEKQLTNELRTSLHEKEILIQEIHHRVKNNMQIISSLLHLQTYGVKEEETLNILQESQNRIKAMSMIHEKLYRSTDLTHINFREYVENLVHDLFESYEVSNNNIQLMVDIGDLELNIDTIIPLGLIINELVTNSLKFAFPECKGSIEISLTTENEHHKLIIADDGVGLPENLNPKKIDSLGLQLVNSLVRQLDGVIKLDRSQGTKFTIEFNEMK